MTNQSKDILDNKYRIERAIRGGQGTVYVAVEIHGSSRKRVAIKRPINSDTEHVSAFRREIEVHKTLTFPGIPKIWDTFLDENELPHAVIEYIDGDDLAVYFDENEPGIRRT
jgi:serine/threonine protein kinase